MSNQASEVFDSLNPSKILVALLQELKTFSIPLDSFLSIPKEEQSLEVNYDDETKSFVFNLKDVNLKEEE
jgi:hypothetical protein